MSDIEYMAKLQRLHQILQPDYDWDLYDEDGPDIEDRFRECCILLSNEANENDSPVVGCGSYKLTDTPRALYRLLWLLRPKGLDFSDMYKAQLLEFALPDRRFVCEFYWFKYEAGLYFYAVREAVGGHGSGIIGGWPGCDNGWYCTDPLGNLFFQVVREIIEYEHTVYGGNNFKV